jgi:hypothetical protein
LDLDLNHGFLLFSQQFPWWGATGTRVNRISRETVEKTGENHGLNLNPTLGGFMVLMLVLD